MDSTFITILCCSFVLVKVPNLINEKKWKEPSTQMKADFMRNSLTEFLSKVGKKVFKNDMYNTLHCPITFGYLMVFVA